MFRSSHCMYSVRKHPPDRVTSPGSNPQPRPKVSRVPTEQRGNRTNGIYILTCVPLRGRLWQVPELRSGVDMLTFHPLPHHRLFVSFFFFKVCIKSADISHPARATGLHLRWTRYVIQEFFLQASRNIDLGVVLHPSHCNIPVPPRKTCCKTIDTHA